jgi:hypothetical protein
MPPPSWGANGPGAWEFLLRPDPPGPRGTLGELCATLHRRPDHAHGKVGYLLLETTGQHNILPIAQRMDQIQTVLRGLLVNTLGAVEDICPSCGQQTLVGRS